MCIVVGRVRSREHFREPEISDLADRVGHRAVLCDFECRRLIRGTPGDQDVAQGKAAGGEKKGSTRQSEQETQLVGSSIRSAELSGDNNL
jgi:hypothetical protein